FSATNDYYERYWARYDKIDGSVYGGPVPPSGFTNGGGKHHYVFTVAGHQPGSFTNWGYKGLLDLSGQEDTDTTLTWPPPPKGEGGSNASCNVLPNPRNNNVTMGVWHCIQFHLNASHFEAWVDGTKTLDVSPTGWPTGGGWKEVSVYRQHGE